MSISDYTRGVLDAGRRGWLIEREPPGPTQPHYWTGRISGPRIWSTDPNQGVRFATKESADAIIRFIRFATAEAHEHMWEDGTCERTPADCAISAFRTGLAEQRGDAR